MPQKPLVRSLVRHSYDCVVDRCARLFAFSGDTEHRPVTDDIRSRAINLAIDDLITLSINARRLITVCGLTPREPSFKVHHQKFYIEDDEVKFRSQETFSTLNELFGIIIHSETLEIFDSDFDIKLRLNVGDAEGINDVLERYGLTTSVWKFFNPKILIKSDRSSPYLFDVREIVTCIDRNLLPKAIETAQEQGIFLEDEYRGGM